MNKAKLLKNMREILGKLTPVSDYRTGFENAIYVVSEMLDDDPLITPDMSQGLNYKLTTPITPALEWKPVSEGIEPYKITCCGQTQSCTRSLDTLILEESTSGYRTDVSCMT